MSQSQIVLILSGFPRQSETFALNEALALEQRGLLAAMFATKPGDGQPPQPGSERLINQVQFLSASSAGEQAQQVLNALAGRPVSGVHAYFAHFPTEVAAIVAQQLGVPYGFSIHARDARKVSAQELARRATNAACVIACNDDVARSLHHSRAPVHLLPHGVDIQRFRPSPPPPAEPLRLLAVGRLVAKKGFDVLVAALARLDFPFHLRIVGEGPERERLETQITAAHLTNHITFCGGKTHTELPQAYADSHVVIVPSVADASGDRDGLPNVVLEALASERPVVATDMGAIPSAITHGENGLIIPAGNATACAAALQRLAADPRLRRFLGRNGRDRVERDYELGRCTERLCDLLASLYA
ncbi:MAG: glycosyltransferase family 4 protein [Deltaproteobacteria bacterium]|nr:glycosyltransferase family 4 protein [Deltaproteobacteria bacterium]